jgi:glycosyltransferase involved in cell wall biosynthesis/GNAT superfamily N-acetyltransferase
MLGASAVEDRVPVIVGNTVATRILWVVKGLGPGGAERLLTAAARAHDPDQMVATCAYVLPGKDHLATDLERAGVPTVCLGSSARDVRWVLRLVQLVRSADVDVVHVHSPLPGAVARLAALSIPRLRRPAIVTTEHNAWSTFHPLTRWINRTTMHLDDAVIAVSSETLESLSPRIRARALLVHHGIDVRQVAAGRAQRAARRAELGVADDVVVIGTVANFRAQKDHPTLLAAMAEVVDLPVHLVVVGQGPLEVETRRMSHDLGLDERVTFTGFRSDATEVMAAFDVFVLSSSWEGLPVAVMEALALGLPVVSTSVGGVAELLTDGHDALLVPPGSPSQLAAALRRVVGDEALRARLATAAADRAAAVDVSRSIAEIEEVYRTVAPAWNATRAAQDTGPVLPPAPSRSSTGGPGLLQGYDIRPAQESDRAALLALAAATLGWHDDERHGRLFAWKHDENPFGPSPMWVATAAGSIVGLRAFLRWQLQRGAEHIDAVRAVDTATHPDHQGKGLFTALTLHALDAVAADGVDLVFNTPNDSSLPGYLKMGWTEIGRLPAAARFAGAAGLVRAARSRTAADLWSVPLRIGLDVDAWLDIHQPDVDRATDPRLITTPVTSDLWRWRFGGDLLGYRVVESRDGTGAVVVRARRRGASLELVHAASSGPSAAVEDAARLALHESGAGHLLALDHADLRRGLVPLPRIGPRLVMRSVSGVAAPPLANWALTLGDVELF